MSELNAAPASAQPNAEGVPPQTPNPGVGENPPGTMVTREEFGKIEKQLNFLAAEIRRSKTQEPAPVKPTDKEPSPKDGLEMLRAEIISERQAAVQERIESSVATAVASFGVDAENAELLEDHLHRRYGTRFKVDGRSVVVENELGEKVPVKDFVGDLLKSKYGERFKPAPATASLPRGGNTTTQTIKPYHELPEDQRLKMTPEQFDSNFRTISDRK